MYVLWGLSHCEVFDRNVCSVSVHVPLIKVSLLCLTVCLCLGLLCLFVTLFILFLASFSVFVPLFPFFFFFGSLWFFIPLFYVPLISLFNYISLFFHSTSFADFLSLSPCVYVCVCLCVCVCMGFIIPYVPSF